MPRSFAARPLVLALAGALVLAAAPDAQQPASAPDGRLLREARPGEVWITAPELGSAPPAPARVPASLISAITDTTPPTAPGNLVVELNGLFRMLARWDAAGDPESGIDYYAFALGTGTTPETEANVRYWQSTGTTTTATISMALTEGATYYLSVRANNGANLSSPVVRSAALVPMRVLYGGAANAMSYLITPTGFDAAGGAISTWSASRIAELSDFMDKMLPVLAGLYGPPSSSYTVRLVRDQRYATSAIFFPSTDEIHVGDTVTYQLLTHEMIHAMRRDRILSGGKVWEYDPTLSGFEEGFAQAVSYDAMTEFAKRYPSFGLTQQVYESSHAWDYDFQNVPQLRTTDFWSDTGGMNLHYMRYEVAAAAIAKIEIEHPGFYRAFNAEYYRRLNASPLLTSSRALMKDVIQTVTPTIEGLPASDWIDRQYVFECKNDYGKKLWVRTQHYPTREYFIFNYVHFYETFTNGSDWVIPLSGGGYRYYGLNGSLGTGTLRNSAGAIVWQQAQQITPTDNPPAYLGFGSDEVHLTTQASNQPWPGGDASKYVTSLLPLDLYRLTEEFVAGSTTVTGSVYRVVGAPLRNTAGVFGGVAGASGGRILLRHRLYNTAQRATMTAAAFWLAAPWASVDHPATQSNDTIPGVVDVVYIDAAGNAFSAVRAIGIGSSSGNQAFLFDLNRMTPGAAAPLVITQPRDQQVVGGLTAVFAAEGDGTGTPSYRWQRQPAGSAGFVEVVNGTGYSGATSPALTVATLAGMSGDMFRCVIATQAGSVTTAAARLTLADGLTITSQPSSVTRASGLQATFSVTATGAGTLAYQWHRRAAGSSTYSPVANGGSYTGALSATLTVLTSALMSGDQFRCEIGNGLQAIVSGSATLTVVDPPVVTAHPSSVTLSGGASATFTVSASSSMAVTYQWQRQPAGSTAFATLTDDGGGYSGVATATLTVAVAGTVSGDQFRCIVANIAGAVTSAAATLTVVSAPVITGQPVDQAVLRGGDPRFVVTVAGTAPFSYQWQRRTVGGAGFSDLVGGGNYAGTTSRDLAVTSDFPFSGQQFRCVVTNSLGSVTSAVATLTVGSVPEMTAQPANRAVRVRQDAAFTAAASGSPSPSFQWQLSTNGGADWTAIVDGAAFSGAASATLTALKVPLALDGARLRAAATNVFGSATSSTVSLAVSYAATAAPAALTFGANRAADGSFAATGRQDVSIEFSGVSAGWTMTANQPWVHVTATAGSGSARIGVTVSDPGPAVSGPQAAQLTIAAPAAANTPIKVPIALSIVPAPLNAAPFGVVDTPLDNAAGLTGSIAVTGWTLDDVEVTRVRISRDPVPGEPAGAPVYLGDASLVDGARPDLAGGFAALPRNTRGGFGYLLLTNMLPNQGNGTYTLYVHADDADGHSTLLGTRAITCNNLMATTPFGAIDTPGQGETVSGIVNNFGWVLSPGTRRADPLGGGSVTVYIDNVPVGSPSGWTARGDLTALFPPAQYSGIAHALAVFTFDSTTLANGVHTIAWVVIDNMGEAAGIGSRYFTVANGTPLTGGQVAPAALGRPLFDDGAVGERALGSGVLQASFLFQMLVPRPVGVAHPPARDLQRR